MDIQNEQTRLIDNVIKEGNCVNCGACVGLCPYFNYFNGRVVVMDKCSAASGQCVEFCPRAGDNIASIDLAKEDIAIGSFRSIMGARAIDEGIKHHAQNGGVVTALILLAIEKGIIESAVLTKEEDRGSPFGVVCKTRSEVLDSSGSKYSASGSLSALNNAIKTSTDKLGVVGVPCQIQALGKMCQSELPENSAKERVGLKIGLFCTWALDYRKFSQYLLAKGITGSIQKYEVPPPPAEVFQVFTDKGRHDFPLDEIRPMIQNGCNLCKDMTSEQADISVGVFEGRTGWNSVVVRTDIGKKLMEMALKEGVIENCDIPDSQIQHLKTAALNKRKRGRVALEKNGAE